MQRHTNTFVAPFWRRRRRTDDGGRRPPRPVWGLALLAATLCGLAGTGWAAALPDLPRVPLVITPPIGSDGGFIPDNPDCKDLFGAQTQELKVEPVPDGSYDRDDGTLFVHLDVATDVLLGQLFDFLVTSGPAVEAVIVKGGPNAQLYDYTAMPVTSGDNLHAPDNPMSGKFFDISHISFCYNVITGASKSGTKFEDLNGDGSRDPGEPGLPGWDIHLFGTSGGGDPVDETVTTDDDGNYTFNDVPPGTYLVCEILQAGWIQSFPTSGAFCGNTGAGPLGYNVVLTSGEHEIGNDFGNFQLASKSGTKFEDLNRNGSRDPGEPGLPGWDIHLFGTSGGGEPVDETVTTDDDGNYTFNDVPPGTYTVCEILQAGWTQTFPTTGADCTGDPGAAPIGYDVELTSGEDDTGNDFGNRRPYGQDPGDTTAGNPYDGNSP